MSANCRNAHCPSSEGNVGGWKEFRAWRGTRTRALLGPRCMVARPPGRMHWLRSCRLRVGQYHDLSGIRGIREDFPIAGDGGVEDDLTEAIFRRTKTLALEDRSVLQGEHC